MKKFNDIKSVFEAFNDLKVLVVGDVMVDAYLWGKVERISPEAPVPIVAVNKRESRLGGAANVAINIKAMGAIPLLCSVIGNDRHAEDLLMLMNNLSMDTTGMVLSDDRVTTVKTRIIGNNHQLLRVDDEIVSELNSKEQSLLLSRITEIIEKQKPEVVIFEDYDKGVLGETIINKIVALCVERNIPTSVDPKKKNFHHYKNVSLFKPNLSELKSGLKIDIEKPSAEKLSTTTATFKKENNITTLMVTLSENGVYISNENVDKIIPAHIRNISDVSGAGDTVISVASLCLAIGLSAELTAAIANLAGGLVCEKVGVVPIDKQQLLEEASLLKI